MRFLRKMVISTSVLGFVLAAVGGVNAQTVAKPKTSTAAPLNTVFAKVGDIEITHDEYNAAFNSATRSKFYHGKPPDSEIAALQREVGDQVVLRILYLHDAKQRNLRPDAASINKQIQTYEQRYAGSEQWKKNREQLLPPLVARLEQEDLLSQLEKIVRDGVKANEKQAKAYYAAHQEQFTEPEQMRVSLILLKVDPPASSGEHLIRGYLASGRKRDWSTFTAAFAFSPVPNAVHAALLCSRCANSCARTLTSSNV